MTEDKLQETLRSPGRPRDAGRDTAILDAALGLVAEVGYERVSMDAVAARARASKATIYRRWPSKGALVAAAVHCRATVELVLADTGTLRGDLLALVGQLADIIGKQDLALLTGVFAGMRNDPQLADALRCDLFTDKTALTMAVFERATMRGEPVRADANRLFHEVAPAVVIHHLMVAGRPADDAFVTHLVDDVLLPVLTTP